MTGKIYERETTNYLYYLTTPNPSLFFLHQAAMEEQDLPSNDVKSPRSSFIPSTFRWSAPNNLSPLSTSELSSSTTPRISSCLYDFCEEESDEELSQLVETGCSTPSQPDERLTVSHRDGPFKICLKLREGCKAPLFRRVLDHKLVSSKLEELASNHNY